MKNELEQILKNLGDMINISLEPDSEGLCAIRVDDKLTFEIQPDPSQEQILIGSLLTEIPPGKFKENVFTQTLKANNQIPRRGCFAFNEETSELVLFEYIFLHNLKAKHLKNILAEFIEKAMNWKESIEAGQEAPTDFLRKIEQSKPSIYNPKL